MPGPVNNRPTPQSQPIQSSGPANNTAGTVGAAAGAAAAAVAAAAAAAASAGPSDTARVPVAPSADFSPASVSTSQTDPGNVAIMHAALNDETAGQIFDVLSDNQSNDFAQIALILKTEGNALGEGKGQEIFQKLMVGKNKEQYQAMFQEAISAMSSPPTAEEKANFIQFLAEGTVGVSEDDPSC